MPEHISIHAMNLGELETEVLRKLWIQTLEDDNGWSPDESFIKYSRYRVRKKINKVYAEMVTMAKALRGWFIITLKENYSQYPVPLNCFDIDDQSVYYFNSATSYAKLEVHEDSYIEEELLPGYKTQPGTPQYVYVADRNKMVVKLGVAPAPNADGTAITLGTGIVSLSAGSPYGTLEGVSGVAGLTSASLKYVDSQGQNFSEIGVVTGLTILNLTDDSKGVITSITTTNTANDTLNCTSISGGATNVWAAGDEMRIIGGEYGGFVEVGDVDAEFLLHSTMGNLPYPGITMAEGNLLVRGFFYPALLQDLNQYPELSPLFHYAIAVGAAADLGLEEPVDSPEFAQAQAYKAQYTDALAGLSDFGASQYKSGSFQLVSKR